MDKNTYQSMYCQIEMKDERKQMMLADLKNNEGKANGHKRYLLPKIAVAVLCILVMSGTTAFAEKYFNVVDRITKSVQELSYDRIKLTKEQKNVYKDYSMELNQTLEFANGTLHLDGVMYDSSFIYIPFTITHNSSRNNKMNDLDIGEIDFGIDDDSSNISVSSIILEGNNTTQRGAFTISSTVPIKKGTMVHVLDDHKKELSAFQLTRKTFAQHIDLSKVKSHNGITIEDMSITPLSLVVIGTHKEISSINYDIVLKDGTSVKMAACGGACFDDDEENKLCEFNARMLFEAPIDLSKVKEIRLTSQFLDNDLVVPYKVK